MAENKLVLILGQKEFTKYKERLSKKIQRIKTQWDEKVVTMRNPETKKMETVSYAELDGIQDIPTLFNKEDETFCKMDISKYVKRFL